MTREDVSYTHMTRDEAFELLDRIACGMARAFGPACEALVQDVDAGRCTVLSIYNGHVSGRQEGSTLSIYGADTADGIVDEEAPHNLFLDVDCNEVRMRDGRRIKSSTWLVRGDSYVLGLGLNMDITEIGRVADLLGSLAAVDGDLHDTLTGGARVSEDADSLVEECLGHLGKPAEALSKNERIELVRLLRDRGFFDYQRSAPALAARLGVSKSTIYNYLHTATHTG